MSVCIDGASSMKGRNEEFVAILQKALPMPDALISFRFILHQQNLFAKSGLQREIRKGVTSFVGYIQANAMRHWQVVKYPI